jgi:hypothetical protein
MKMISRDGIGTPPIRRKFSDYILVYYIIITHIKDSSWPVIFPFNYAAVFFILFTTCLALISIFRLFNLSAKNPTSCYSVVGGAWP